MKVVEKYYSKWDVRRQARLERRLEDFWASDPFAGEIGGYGATAAPTILRFLRTRFSRHADDARSAGMRRAGRTSGALRVKLVIPDRRGLLRVEASNLLPAYCKDSACALVLRID